MPGVGQSRTLHELNPMTGCVDLNDRGTNILVTRRAKFSATLNWTLSDGNGFEPPVSRLTYKFY